MVLTLHAKGFGITRGCISSANYLIIVNNCLRGKIFPIQGICQVDPLSSFIFVLVWSCLSRFLSFKRSANSGKIATHSIKSSQFCSTHFQFFDDMFLFSTFDIKALENLFDVVKILNVLLV